MGLSDYRSNSQTVFTLLQSIESARAGSAALFSPGRPSASYATVLQQVIRTASFLSRRGVSNSDRVACVLPNGPEMVSLFLGISSVAACAPLNPNYRANDFEFYLGDLRPKLLIVDSELDTPAREVANKLGIETVELNTSRTHEAGVFRLGPDEGLSDFLAAGSDDVALLLHTSGTTSRPKLVPLTHRNLCVSARNIAKSLALTSDDLCLNIMPLFHIHGLIGAVLSSLSTGAGVVCSPGFHASQFFGWMKEFQPTWYSAVPTMHQAILARVGENAGAISSRLRLIRSCSASLAPALMAELEKTFRVPVIEAYGMTEASHQMASNPLPPRARKPGSVGIATGIDVGIMDEAGNLLAVGITGEVVIRGESITRGYESNQEANSKAFVNGWFRTGDQGYIDSDGYLFLTGRIKELINRGGEKISPREIDELLLSHPAVAQALAFAIPDERLGEEVGAAVVLKAGHSATDLEIREYLASLTADFKVPRQIVFLEKLPTGPTGKLQRIGLAGVLGLEKKQSSEEKDFVAPRNQTEATLAELWSVVLGRKNPSINEDFFAVGGDSILATQLIGRIRKRFGVEVSMPRLFSSPTIQALSEWLLQQQSVPELVQDTMTRVNRSKDITLSFPQRRMWFAAQYAGESAIYNRAFGVRLAGPLDIFQIQQSLTAVQERHEILRTNYRLRDGIPVQTVGNSRPVAISLVDLTREPEERRIAAAADWAREETRKPFNLATDLMLRAGLAKLGPDDHLLLFITHHIAFDATSQAPFLKDLASAYSGVPSPLPLLDYADFASWQASRSSEELNEIVQWWRQELRDLPNVHRFPSDFCRPARQSYRGGSVSATLGSEVSEQISSLARKLGATPFMVVLAAFSALAYRYSGSEESVIGTPTSGRNIAETEDMVGLFVNLLVIRTKFDPSCSFTEHVRRVRETTLKALEHQDLPFEKLVEGLAPERSLAHSPLFQIMFEYRNHPAAELKIGGVAAEPFEFESGYSQYDLHFDLRPSQSSLGCVLHYNADLFKRESAERLLGNFRTVLTSALADPSRKASELECEGPGAAATAVHVPEESEEQGPAEVDFPRKKRSPGESFRLSFAQERLWFLHQLEPDNATYNIPVWLRLTGNLDGEALRRSFEFVLGRHESLRTVFQSRDGAPIQVVQGVANFSLPIVNAENLSGAELHALARREILRPFDLSKDAMLRAAVYRVGPDDHYLLIVVHHIAADGWSMPILQQELGSAYSAYVRGQEPNLPQLPVQYVDYADWQRGFLSGKVFEEQLEFWTRQLKGAPSNPLLLTDRPRGARQTYGGERYIVPMSAEFEAELNRFNRKERVTLFMTLLAGLEALLYRMTGQADIVVGAAIANRTRMEIEPLVGFFVNTLALRCDFSDDPTFREVLNRIRETTLQAYQNQDLPFEKLVQALQPERSLSHTPVFQVILAVQNTPDEITDFGPLAVVQEDIDEQVAKFDLAISVEFKPRLRIAYNVNTDLFEHETIVRFAEYLENFIRAAMITPEARVSELTIMSGGERDQLLQWGRNEREYPQKAVHEIFEEVAELSPNAIAIVAGDKQHSYKELNERANQLARALHKVGIGPGKRVGLLMRRSFETIASMVATLKLGAAYVPLDKDYPAQRIEFLSKDCELAAVLTTPDMIDRVPAGQQIVRADEAESNPTEPLKIHVAPDQAAYVIYTSGSTGQPKGVEVTHRGIVRLVFAQEYAQFGPSETTLQLAPLSFDASTLEIWAALLHGGSCVLFSGSRIDAEQVGTAISRHNVSTLWLTASLFNSIIDESPKALAPVRQLLAGGEALSVSHVRRAFSALKQTQLINGYGPTENTTFSCCHRITAETLKNRASIPIGKPIANTDAFILDRRMELVPVGVPGELYLGGDGLAIGYVNRPELTAEKFVTANVEGEPRRLYRTGDICRWLNDGTIEFLGRGDEQVKIRGFRIELGEIETAIAGNDAINSVAVLVSGEGANKRLIAYVVAKKGREIVGPKLREYLRESLPDYMIPAQYVFLPALPISKNGKIDKSALPEPTGTPAQEILTAPHDPVEAKLKSIWENVLGVAPIGVDQDFFELGGHSLLATKLLARVERMFGAKLPIASIFQYSTIVEFAPLVRNQVAFAKPAGASKPPLLWVGGGTFLRPIAKWLQPDRALISVSLDAEEWGALKEPYELQTIASILAKRILKDHPTGPYHLAGWCFEGLLAYETAQQLRAQGAEVGLLVVVDAATPASRKPFTGRGEAIARIQRELFHAGRLIRSSPSKWPAYVRERLQELSKRLARRKWHNSYREGMAANNAGEDESNRVLYLALVDYVPKPYAGSLLFFQAAERPMGKFWDLAWEWKELTDNRCDSREIPGDHVTLLKAPNIDLLAEHLKTALDSTQDSQPGQRQTAAMSYV